MNSRKTKINSISKNSCKSVDGEVNELKNQQFTLNDSIEKDTPLKNKSFRELNEGIAIYIEKVKNLEIQNKTLLNEIEKLKGGSEQEIYQKEIEKIQSLLKNSETHKKPMKTQIDCFKNKIAEMAKRLVVLEDVNSQYRVTIEDQREELENFEEELFELKKFKAIQDLDSEKTKQEAATLKNEIKKLQEDYENEISAQITLENNIKTEKETKEK